MRASFSRLSTVTIYYCYQAEGVAAKNATAKRRDEHEGTGLELTASQVVPGKPCGLTS
jgi:hypothetical protein